MAKVPLPERFKVLVKHYGVECPKCSNHIITEKHFFDKKVKCPKCGFEGTVDYPIGLTFVEFASAGVSLTMSRAE